MSGSLTQMKVSKTEDMDAIKLVGIMKRYIYYILLVVLPFFAFGCEREEAPVEPVYKDVGKLDVSFTFKNSLTRSITLSPLAQTIEVDVNVNIDGIKWNVTVSEQDNPWCFVDNDIIHEGSGTFTITVVENDGYDDREEVTVSFNTGEYRKDLRVKQNGNVFVMDQVFGIGTKASGSADVMVKVRKGTEWTTQQPSWIKVQTEEVSSSELETEYKMTLQWEETTKESRLGIVELNIEGEDGARSSKYALWQLGDSEYYSNEDGKLLLPARQEESKPLEIRAPSNHIRNLYVPEWVRSIQEENEDGSISWFLTFTSHASDSYSRRETILNYTTFDSDDQKQLAPIYQDSYHAGCLFTAKGFATFAERFNAGESVEDWMQDGVVYVVSEVDMSGLERWVPIGTEERPFNLKFKGMTCNITGLSVLSPLFGVCDGAEISDISFDKTCKFSHENDFNTDFYLASLAGKVTNTTIRNCTTAAEVSLSSKSVQSGSNVYVGGLVAYLGSNSTITESSNTGALNITIERQASTGELYLGGVAGYVAGNVDNCKNTGTLSDTAHSRFRYVGGVAGFATAEASLIKCTNSGAVKHSSTRAVGTVTDMNREIYMGGVVGKSDGKLSELVNSGSAVLNTNAVYIYLGGVAGSIDGGSFYKSYSSKASITYDRPIDAQNTSGNLGKFVYVGGVVGSLNIPLEWDCSDMPVSCDISSAAMQNGGDLLVGGMIGVAKQSLKLRSPKWDGNINFYMSGSTTETNNTCIGGFVGLAENSMTDVSGALTSDTGTIKVWAVRNIYWKAPTAIGGVIGCASNGCTISDSINNASLLWDATTTASNAAGVVSSGGIVGRIDKGLARISKCTNNGPVQNVLRHEARWQSGKLLGTRSGGIIGTYGYVKANANYDMDTDLFDQYESNNITITDCITTSKLVTYRGLIGGIAGCLYNATVTNCKYTGISPNDRQNCNVAGIAAAVEKSRIENCEVRASLYGVAAGSCEFKAGGIAAYLYKESSIANCKYYGHITTGDNGTNVAYYGGIVGEAEEGCSVTKCSFGGSILGEQITAANYADYIIGNKAIEAVDCTYWDGQ